MFVSPYSQISTVAQASFDVQELPPDGPFVFPAKQNLDPGTPSTIPGMPSDLSDLILSMAYEPNKKIVMDTSKKVFFIVLSMFTFGLAYNINRCIQNYKFRAALMKGGEKEIQVAQKALRCGATHWLSEKDLITLAENKKNKQLQFLFGQLAYDRQIWLWNNDFSRTWNHVFVFDNDWTETFVNHNPAYGPVSVVPYVNNRGSARKIIKTSDKGLKHVFMAFKNAKQDARRNLLESYLPIRPLRDCKNPLLRKIDHNNFEVEEFEGDWLSQVPLRIFSDALKAKDYETAKIFFDHGLDVKNCQYSAKTGILPVVDQVNSHVVFRDLSVDSLRFWLDNGLDPDTVGPDGTLLSICIKQGKFDSVQFLLEKHASVNLQDPKGDTALVTSLKLNHIEIAQILLEHGADPNFQDPKGDTALVTSLKLNHNEIARLLLEHGADSNIGDPLTLVLKKAKSAIKDDREMISLLMNKGAQLTRRNLDIALNCPNALGPWLISEYRAQANAHLEMGDSSYMCALDDAQLGHSSKLQNMIKVTEAWQALQQDMWNLDKVKKN